MEEDQKYHIYINKASGTVQNIGQESLENMIRNSNLSVAELKFLSPPELIETVKNYNKNEPLIIGGGDGTIKSCAETLIEKQTPFGFFPLGTMNLLAKDLNIPIDLPSTIKAYEKGTEIFEMDVGKVNGEHFLCCVGLGTMPETSEYREENRSDSQPILIPKLTVYMLQQMDQRNRKKLTLNLDGKRQFLKTSALVVSNNQYGPQGQWTEDNFKRPNLQDGLLGIYSVAPKTFWEKVRFLLRLGIGDWKKDHALKEWSCRNLSIMSHNKTELLSLDGETKEFNTPLQFLILRKQLKIIVPKEATNNDE